MIDGQSIIVAPAATKQEGRAGNMFRAVLQHSILPALILGLIVTACACWLSPWIPSGHRFL